MPGFGFRLRFGLSNFGGGFSAEQGFEVRFVGLPGVGFWFRF